MKGDKCKDCAYRVVMSYTDGRVFHSADIMCHYAWKHIRDVREDECHYKAKREHHNEEE